jgi:hypothetical protein
LLGQANSSTDFSRFCLQKPVNIPPHKIPWINTTRRYSTEVQTKGLRSEIDTL